MLPSTEIDGIFLLLVDKSGPITGKELGAGTRTPYHRTQDPTARITNLSRRKVRPGDVPRAQRGQERNWAGSRSPASGRPILRTWIQHLQRAPEIYPITRLCHLTDISQHD